jgi:hypothetical protein
LDIEHFMERTGEAGDLDSEGHFTLNFEQAQNKLEASQMLGQRDFLLKVMQACHAADGHHMRFRLTRNEISIRCRFEPDSNLTAATLMDRSLNPLRAESRAAGHLRSALSAARGAGLRDVSWTSAGQTLRLGDKLALEDAPSSEPGLGEFRCKHPKLTLLQRLKEMFASSAAEVQRLLYQRARYFPQMVEFDGREIERGWNRHLSTARAWYRKMSEPHYLIEGYYADPNLPKFIFPGVEMEQWKRYGTLYKWKGVRSQGNRGVNAILSNHWSSAAAPTLLRDFGPDVTLSGGSRVECGLAIALPLNLEGPTEILFVVDGITSLPKQLELGLPGLQCVASGEGLSLDLSGFGIVEDGAYMARLNVLENRIRQFSSMVQQIHGNFLILEKNISGGKHLDADQFYKELYRRLGRNL